jgi:UDP-3-O-[3-hydroxymyristoyl] glucosamine N-acyltransferase
MVAPVRDGVRVSDIVALVDGQLIGDGGQRVWRVRDPERAEPGDLTFVGHPKQISLVRKTRATVFLTDDRTAAHRADEFPCAVIAVDNPALALARVIDRLHPQQVITPLVDTRAHVHLDARIADGVAIGPGAVVGRAILRAGAVVGPLAFVDDDVEVGEGAHIGPGAVVLRGTTIGARTVLHPGVVVGADGFGFAPDGDKNVKVRQLGNARIGSDVEIGSNACIDRGALRDTVVGAGTKIDNLVQVAHGARIGEDAVIVAQTGIAGDADVGDSVVMAGQVGVVPYARIGPRARVGAQSGVTHDVAADAAVSGTPAHPHIDWLKSSVRYRSLDGFVRRLMHAEARIVELEQTLARLAMSTSEGTKAPGAPDHS